VEGAVAVRANGCARAVGHDQAARGDRPGVAGDLEADAARLRGAVPGHAGDAQGPGGDEGPFVVA